ncbi:MAG: ABC transporter substrate-binding protein [Streptosporangiaceae bacterium]
MRKPVGRLLGKPFGVVVLTVTLALPVACGGAAGGGGGSKNSEPIVLGQIASLTGNYTPLGTNDRKAAALAVKQINDAGGVLGRKLKIVVRDDKTEPDQSVIAFKDLVGRGADAVVGSSFSNSALATIPLAQREKIPYLSTAASDQQVHPVRPYVFMAPATSAAYAESLLRYFKATGKTKIAMAYDEKSSYATTGYKATKKMAGRYGVDLVDTERFETTTTDFSSVLTHIRDSGADGLLVWATGTPAVIITKQFGAADMPMPLIMTGAEASTLYTRPAGKAAEGVILNSSIGVIGPDLPDGDLKKTVMRLAKPFEKKYDYYPPQFGMDGYSAVMLLAGAMKKAGSTDPEKVQAALEHLTLLTPNGEYNYTPEDHSGLTYDDIAVDKVKDGDFVPTNWQKRRLSSLSD